jgi:hypothetical protein
LVSLLLLQGRTTTHIGNICTQEIELPLASTVYF